MDRSRFIPLEEIIQEFNLTVIYGGKNYEKTPVRKVSISRPGLQLAGFYDYFDSTRLLVCGKAEWTYMNSLSPEARSRSFDDLFARPIPGLIIARDLEPHEECIAAAKKYDRTLMRCSEETGTLQAMLATFLTKALAPQITRHGVLMEVYGEGVLLLGESGVGKSETAVELIKRGHRLIADDAVEIQRPSQNTLIGSAPELIRYYMELRGIGIIDVRKLFGMAAVKDSQEINLVINLELWREGMLYDRLGLENLYTTILDVDLPTLTVPVKPGRNLAVIIEVAAMNNRHKKMGYNAAQEFTDQINAHFDQQLAQNQSM